MKAMNFLFCLLGIFLSFQGLAQEKEIGLEKLISLAIERNPGLQASERAVRALEYRAKAEGILPEPVLEIGIKNMGLRHYTIGEDMMSGIPISISQKIPFPGKLALRSQMSKTMFRQSNEDFLAKRLRLIREVKEYYAQLFYTQKALKFLQQKNTYLQEAFRIAETRYTVGEGTQADLFKAQVEISQTEDTILSMKEMEDIYRVKLNALLDFPLDTLFGNLQEIPFYALPYELTDFQNWALEKSPFLKKTNFMIKEALLRKQMAQKEFFPDFMLQVGKEFKGALPPMYEFMFGIEIPFYFWKKQTHLLQEARLTLDASYQDRRAMELELLSMIKEHFVMAKTAEKRIALYREKILPQAEHSLQATLSSYQVGKMDFLALLSDINALITYQMEYVKTLADLWSVTAKLEEWTATEILKEK